MSSFPNPQEQREFRCIHCKGKIHIPKDLPPTTGPCPHCGGTITSPAANQPDPAASASFPLPGQAASLPPQSPPPGAAAPPSRPQPAMAPSPSPTAPSPQPSPVEAAQQTHATPSAPITQEAAAPPSEEPPSLPKSSSSRRGWLPLVLIVLLLIGLAVGAVFLIGQQVSQELERRRAQVPTKPEVDEAQYLRIGWRRDAYEVLSHYMAGTTVQEKLPYILHPERLEPVMEAFYGGAKIDDSSTPAELFAVEELSEEDRARGMFMMIYDQPPHFDMRDFFRPLATLEVQYGLKEADLLLSTFARASNFAVDPIRAHAFFKRTPEGLKLDWEVFVQTRYRTFQNFVEMPDAGVSQVFRVFIREDVPEKGIAIPGARTYRLADPAHHGDSVRVNVKVDSKMGRQLSSINWRGTDQEMPITKTATVELVWSQEEPHELQMKRFICWEFLGLGGTADDAPTTEN